MERKLKRVLISVLKVEGLVSSELTSFTRPHVIPNSYNYISSMEHK